jgi:Mor family transcriptional regulator
MDERSIREAVYRLLRLQSELREARIEAGKAFKAAISNGSAVSDLARFYKITRPKIYWLMNEYEKSRNAQY